MNLNKQNMLRYAENVSFVALCIAVANAVFFGTANYTKELGFSVWSIVVLLIFVGSVFAIVCNIKKILKNPILWVLIAYGIWVVISAVRGYYADHTVGHITEDLKRVIYFALFPMILTILNSESRIIKLMKIVVYSSFALSLLTVVLFTSYLSWPSLFNKLIHWGYYGEIINFTKVSGTIVRILFVSTPMQLFGCAFAMYFIAKEKRCKIRYSCIIGLNLFCFLISFTRTLYLAAFVAAILSMLLVFLTADKKTRILAVNRITVSVVACVVLVAGFSLMAKTNYFGYALQRVFVSNVQVEENPLQTPIQDEIIDFENEEEYLQATLISDNIRQNIKKMLQERINENPIFGSGLGARLPDRNTPPEFFYLDLWAKTGVVGLLLFLMPIGVVIFDIFKRAIRGKPFFIGAFWCVGLIGLMVYSVLQPYMNTAPCILMYCCVLCVNSWQKNTTKTD